MVRTMGLPHPVSQQEQRKKHDRSEVDSDPSFRKRKRSHHDSEEEEPKVPEDWSDKIITTHAVTSFFRAPRQFLTHDDAPEGYDFSFIVSEAREAVRGYIQGESVLWFDFQRGGLPLSKLKFGCCWAIAGWAEWVANMLQDKQHVNTLKKAGILDAVRITTRLPMVKDVKDDKMEVWRAILARWSSYSHTMVTAWGEFTFTLEDVSILLQLPLIGDRSPLDITLTRAEKEIQAKLECALKKQGKSRGFNSWVTLFLKKEDPELIDHEFIAFLMLWLARYVLPGCPDVGISPALIPIAIRLSQGVCYPLGPFYLGSLYRRLDLIHEKMKLSAGRYSVLTFIDAPFIQMCLWERFPLSAPSCKLYDASASRYNYRAWAWYDGQPSKVKILTVIDKVKEFKARPYIISGWLWQSRGHLPYSELSTK